MIKFINKNKLLATTAICAISLCANTVKAEEISILDILNNSTTKSSNISWEKVDTAGTDTIQIGDEYFKYTYTIPADYTEIKDKTENISVVNPTSLITHKYFGSAINNPEGTDYGDIEKYVFSNNKVTVSLEDNTDNWKELYIYGEVISNNGTIGDITADFLNNSIETSATRGDKAYSYAHGGAISNVGYIWNGNTWIYGYGTIDNITGDFIGNSVTSTDGTASGGAIYNFLDGSINTITGNFIGNSATGYSAANGGAIYHDSMGYSIKTINGDFIGNSVTSTEDTASGGAIDNLDIIKNINGDFIDNSATSTDGSAEGGAIGNLGLLETITGEFTGNSANSTNDDAIGGAIYNYDRIQNLTGDFVGNRATSTNGSARGGAIGNNDDISSITGYFTNNSATSTYDAQGGAIYNGDTEYGISSITGEFTGNSANSTNGTARGGAIYNGDSTYRVKLTGDFTNNSATSTNGYAYGGSIYNSRTITSVADASVSEDRLQDDVLFQGNYVEDKEGKRYEAIYNIGIINFESNNGGSYTLYDYINGDNTGTINFVSDDNDDATINLYNNIQNQKDINFQAKYVINMISPDDIHAGTSKYSYIQAQNININAALQMMLDVDLEAKEMDRFEADNFTVADGGSIDVTKFNIVTDVTGDIGTTTEVEFIVSDNATGLDKITNVTEAVGEVYTYTVTFNPDTGAFEFVSTGLVHEPVEPSAPAPEEVAPNQAPALTTNTTVTTVETVVAQIFERDVTISSDTNYGSDTPYSSERVSEEATSDGVNIHNDKSVWVKTFGSDDDVKVENFNGTIDSEAYGVVGGVDSKVFTYDNGVKAAYGIYGAYVGGKQKYNDSKIEQKSGYLGVSASFRKNNMFSNFTLNGGYVTSESNTELGKDEFDTKVVSVANKTGFDIKAGNNWTITPAMYVAYTGMDTEDYTNKAGVKMENEFSNVVTLAPELKVRKGFDNGVGTYAKVSYKHYIYDSEVKADDVVLEEMSAKPYVEYGFGVEKNWADKSGYAELTRRDGGREGWNVNLGLQFDF